MVSYIGPPQHHMTGSAMGWMTMVRWTLLLPLVLPGGAGRALLTVLDVLRPRRNLQPRMPAINPH
jgi:hypothetical protein